MANPARPSTTTPDFPPANDAPTPPTELEAALLAEYRRLNANLVSLSTSLAALAGSADEARSAGARSGAGSGPAAPAAAMATAAGTADALRLLERKTTSVCTSLKSSVYGIVLMQQIENDGGPSAEGEEGSG